MILILILIFFLTITEFIPTRKKKIGERRKKENLREEESVGMEAKGLFRGIMDMK